LMATQSGEEGLREGGDVRVFQASKETKSFLTRSQKRKKALNRLDEGDENELKQRQRGEFLHGENE